MFCHCAIKCDDDGFVRYDEIFGLFYHIEPETLLSMD